MSVGIKGPATNLNDANKRNGKILLEILGLCAVLSLAAYLRLVRVGVNPGWYTDEGTEINIVQNLLLGKDQYLAISPALFLIGRLPLFFWILAGIFKVWGTSMAVLRTFTALLGVLSVALLYSSLRTTFKNEAVLALLSAFLLAIYPQAVVYSRLGFTYNLLAPLLLLTFWGLLKFLGNPRPAWLVLASLSLGAACLSDLMAFLMVPVFILVVSTRSWRSLLWSLPLALLPLAVYGVVLLAASPQTFFFDLNFNLHRVNSLPLWGQLVWDAINLANLVKSDSWMLPAVIGMFLLKPVRLSRLVLLAFLLPFGMVAAKMNLVGLNYYHLIPLLPFITLGFAGLLVFMVPLVSQALRKGLQDILRLWGWQPVRPVLKRGTQGLVALVVAFALAVGVISPFGFVLYQLVGQVSDGFETSIDSALLDPAQAEEVVQFINQQVHPGDLVISNPALSWLFTANVADFEEAAAAQGFATGGYPANVPASRFVYPLALKGARFVVFDPFWPSWGVSRIPTLAGLVNQVEQWPAVFTTAEFTVYENPDLK